MMEKLKSLESILLELPCLKEDHIPSSSGYNVLKKMARKEVVSLFSKTIQTMTAFPPFGEIILPYFQMGAVDSLDLFGLDELIIFSFYWKNRERYKRVLDIGGNIGLHSIILNLCGFKVNVYEPDPVHFETLIQNLQLNNCKNVNAYKEAVSTSNGVAEFTRVLGNTTSSHLSGSKKPYGEIETFLVPLRNIQDLVFSTDLIKMDVEGHEKDILLALQSEHWKQVDAIVEIGSAENAQQVFCHLKHIKVNAFAQKIGWKKVNQLSDMPTSHRDGSLFISLKEGMPWN